MLIVAKPVFYGLCASMEDFVQLLDISDFIVLYIDVM
jgi:hypothetical protein